MCLFLLIISPFAFHYFTLHFSLIICPFNFKHFNSKAAHPTIIRICIVTGSVSTRFSSERAFYCCVSLATYRHVRSPLSLSRPFCSVCWIARSKVNPPLEVRGLGSKPARKMGGLVGARQRLPLPKASTHATNFNSISEPYTEILGGEDVFIDQHSTINLTCIVHTPDNPAHVFWLRDGKV